MYQLCIADRTGSVHKVAAYGMDTITELHDVTDLDPVNHLFPGVEKVVLQRSVGAVDFLIGQNFRRLQPFGGVSTGNL